MLRRYFLAFLLCWTTSGAIAHELSLGFHYGDPPVQSRAGPAPALDLNFLTGALPPIVTFSRASSATDGLYTDAAGSSFNTYSTNVARILTAGLLIEEARTNQLLNSAVPVTQTTGSLGTGTYVFWCIGTGSDTSSAGTATASGLGAITCSQGTFQTIVVTVAGTLTFTKSGSIDRFQLELGAVPTSFISSAGATATRAADVATVALSSTSIPANPSALTIIGKFKSPAGFDTTNTYTPVEIDDGTTNNRLLLRFTAAANSPLQAVSIVGGVGQGALSIYPIPPTATTIRFWFAITSGNAAAQAIGQTKQTNAALFPAGLTTLRIGEQIGSLQLSAPIARLQIYSTRLPDAQAAAIATGM